MLLITVVDNLFQLTSLEGEEIHFIVLIEIQFIFL